MPGNFRLPGHLLSHWKIWWRVSGSNGRPIAYRASLSGHCLPTLAVANARRDQIPILARSAFIGNIRVGRQDLSACILLDHGVAAFVVLGHLKEFPIANLPGLHVDSVTLDAVTGLATTGLTGRTFLQVSPQTLVPDIFRWSAQYRG